MKKLMILFFFTILNQSIFFAYSNEPVPEQSACRVRAEIMADSYKLKGYERENFIKAKVKICGIHIGYNDDNYILDIEKLTYAINIYKEIDIAVGELIGTLDIRSYKYIVKASKYRGLRSEDYLWDAIYDLTDILEISNKGEYYFKRGEVYYLLEEKEKACKDFKQASKLGYKQASNLVDRYNCY